ncbi:PREDICTED: uncharacterized protein LOC104701788 isoform X2 [Camelina sativa]|uniref:Uncharacterized protein LOC104701788 isoform X2 n=1 Tax=Camelina sativa TaxID=90675 RepID=A0ABM0STC5_CAMSA|nr:PREDICTED: uncharacterized protein LOC104701788 isoform X2 [Camelina sativa]
MFARRLTSSFFKGSSTSSSSDKTGKAGTLGSFGRKAVSFVLITVTGGVALSALDDLSIYHGCSRFLITADTNLTMICYQWDGFIDIRINFERQRNLNSCKAMEKVINSKAMIEAIGEPIEKGPWYSASLAVSHQRHSVSCSFPVIGPQGTGILHLKAVRNGDSLLGFLKQRDWDILMMDALVHVPSNDGPQQTLRINISNMVDPSPGIDNNKPSEPQEELKRERTLCDDVRTLPSWSSWLGFYFILVEQQRIESC